MLIWEMNTKKMIRSVAFSPDGALLAAAFKNGSLSVYNSENQTVVKEFKTLAKEQIDALEFSPDGQLLVAGSYDQCIYVIGTKSWKMKKPLKGHTSSISHLSISDDSSTLITNSRDYEIMYWDLATSSRLKTAASPELRISKWNNILGWPVQGIWTYSADGTDVNALSVSGGSNSSGTDEEVIATADDFGQITLYKFPCVEKTPKFKQFCGHSAHVTGVEFSRDSSTLISIGGGDYGVFQWSHVNYAASASPAVDTPQESVVSDHDLQVVSSTEKSTTRKVESLHEYVAVTVGNTDINGDVGAT